MTTRIGSKWAVSCTLFLCIVAFGTASGQSTTSESAPNIEILKLKWEKQMRLPQSYDPSGGGSTGTINDPTRSSRGGSGGGSGSAGSDTSGSTTQGMQPSAPSRVLFVYVYSMKIKNAGSKEIEGLAWDYVFVDSSTSAELGRHQFLSFEKVGPDKTATFQSEQRTPPVRTLRTQTAEDNKQGKLSEKSVIKCVLYADGTTWREANTSEDVCNLLTKGKVGLSRKRSTGL
jgi:hypothetical protein